MPTPSSSTKTDADPHIRWTKGDYVRIALWVAFVVAELSLFIAAMVLFTQESGEPDPERRKRKHSEGNVCMAVCGGLFGLLFLVMWLAPLFAKQ